MPREKTLRANLILLIKIVNLEKYFDFVVSAMYAFGCFLNLPHIDMFVFVYRYFRFYSLSQFESVFFSINISYFSFQWFS